MQIRNRKQVYLILASGVVGLCLAFGFQNCGGGFSGQVTGDSEIAMPLINIRFGRTFDVGTPSCQSLIKKIGSSDDATADLQACIDSVPEGYVLELPAGKVMISQTIHLRKAITLTTAGMRGLLCDADNLGSCFEMRATPDASTGSGSDGLLDIVADDSQVLSIIVNGNKEARVDSNSAKLCRGQAIAGHPELAVVNGWGVNMHARGSGLVIKGVVSTNALCGTGFFVERADNSHIVGNAFVRNGIHLPAEQKGNYSDGVTVHHATLSEISSNLFVDNTDVDLIFGNCLNCRIQGNTVKHTADSTKASFVAIMFQAFAKDGFGTYTGSDVSGNSVDCGDRRNCGIGLYLGSESWYPYLIRGGYYHDNVITNVRNGFVIEAADGDLRIRDNIVSNAGGATWYTNLQGCQAAGHAYLLPNSNHVIIEDTQIGRDRYDRFSLSQYLPMAAGVGELDWNSAPNPGANCTRMIARSQIVTSFASILQRQPNFIEISNLEPFLYAGHTQAELEASLRQSNEYTLLHPKQPSDSGSSPNQNSQSSTTVSNTPVTTPVSPVQTLLRELFQSFLQHDPGDGLPAAVKDMSCYDVAHMVAQSDEAYRNHYNAMNDREFMNYLYSGLLQRSGDEAGLNAWAGELAAGKDRISVIDTFMTYDEFKLRCSKLGLRYK